MRRTIDAATGSRLMELELRRWLADHLGVDEAEILRDASLADALALDSLDLAEMLTAFEADFGIELKSASCGTVATFGDFVTLVRECGRTVGAPVVPFVRAVVSKARADVGPGLERVGWLTPYLASVVADDARAAGRGARLDVTVTDDATPLTIDRVAHYFRDLGRRGVDVHVHARH